jgi:hypothetical protein
MNARNGVSSPLEGALASEGFMHIEGMNKTREDRRWKLTDKDLHTNVWEQLE